MAAGLPNAQVVDLEYNAAFNLLAAGTHGRGVFVVQPTSAGATVTVSVNGPEQVTDDAGQLTGELTITRLSSVGPLSVLLSSSDPTAATVQASVNVTGAQVLELHVAEGNGTVNFGNADFGSPQLTCNT